jgi:HSP20 family molecular chaperone IbpA
MEWPAWMAGRSILDFPESWVETLGEAAVRVEEFEENNHLVVRAEAPGVDPEKDIEITVTEGTLRIMVQPKKRASVTIAANSSTDHLFARLHFRPVPQTKT